jgi:cell surface protein SprA
MLAVGPKSFANSAFEYDYFLQQEDTGKIKYPYHEIPDYPTTGVETPHGPYLKLPSNIKSSVIFNTETQQYEFSENVGKITFRPTSDVSLDEYRQYDMQHAVREYWRQKASSKTAGQGFKPKINVGGEAFDKIFGSNTINITPQGSAELIFGYNLSRVDNPQLSEKLRKTPSFNFDEKIQMNVKGSIGEKLTLGVSYNTEATFDFENKTKLGFQGQEDDIIKKVEAGNVSLPLTGSLITGSQSLFGLKTEMQFGKLTVTTILSQQKGETQVIETKGGAQLSEFNISADSYEANKHFFISHYFRDNYDKALSTLPVISSAINITSIEVWVTNKSNTLDNVRNVVAFTDLGEIDKNVINPSFTVTFGSEFPYNGGNTLYGSFNTVGSIRDISQVSNYLGTFPKFYLGQDYEKIENARKLTDREYTFNAKLGYISLNTPLNADEILAVAYQYTANGSTYQVGEFSTDVSAPKTLILKLLKGTNLTPRVRNWALMMKNIYSIGAYQLSNQDFQFNVLYQDDKTGNSVNYLTDGDIKNQILLKVLNLDRVNAQMDPTPDGLFDFIEGITINSANGRVIFPVLEPFGSYLSKKLNNNVAAQKYVYQELYDSTQTFAKQIAEKDKFRLQGKYQSSSTSDIPLNAMNVPQGSVTVTAGGIKLTENIDYTVDYTLGRVKIMNTGLLQSGTPIRISLENQSLFSIQTKTLIGTHMNYKISDNFNLGATILHLNQRPLTQKVNFGDEPISNTIWGFNGNYSTQSRFITRMIDKLPFIQTKEISSISVDGEFAQLLPGSAAAIGKKGTSYIDDFEGSETTNDLSTFSAWTLASIPQNQPDLFPESSLMNKLDLGYNRAKLAWYVIDPLFTRNTSLTPGSITSDDKSSNFVREVFEKEIFPNKQSQNNLPTNIPILNLAFYPDERGPYNYNPIGVDPNTGNFKNPAAHWGGVMRQISPNDFEAANMQYIEFWVMDPFIEQDSLNSGGDMYINLGNVSEDVLRDGRKAFENGLPGPDQVDKVDTTAWGLVPKNQQITPAFDQDPATRIAQDVGLDGLSDNNEATFFKPYLDSLALLYGAGSTAYKLAKKDPSTDDYKYYRSTEFENPEVGILNRYKSYNGLENNSPAADVSGNIGSSTLPNSEDINMDNTLSEEESYYQYKLSVRKNDLQIGKNYVTDKIVATVKLDNGKNSTVTWYQFKVPISEPEKAVGTIQDFKSIRFMRIFLKGFSQRVILRFAELQLVRGEWRKYTGPLLQGSEGTADPQETGDFEISAVNIEENGDKKPVNYVLPPGFNRVIDPSSPELRQLNEQSMLYRVRDLADGDAKAAFKNVQLDIRQYGRLRMEVHGEAIAPQRLKDGDLTVFIRLGTDYRNNYYEYEVPLHVTIPIGRNFKPDDDNERALVWPASNSFNIDLSLLEKIKLMRNDLIQKGGTNVTMLTRFSYADGKNRAYVCGNPNLSDVKTIMIGVRNPSNIDNSYSNDGLAKTAEIWVNELRLTDFNDKSGWAANARATAKLADLGTISIAGSSITPGFGSIEKKVNERAIASTLSYDLATSLELGKFFPAKSGIRIPMFIGYSETFIRPEYSLLDPDIPLNVALAHAPNDSARSSLLKISQDYTRRRSLNFTNVKLGKLSTKPKPWDLGNWTASYSFNDVYSYNLTTEYLFQRKYRLALGYNYSLRPKNVQPFKNVSFLKSNYFAMIRDFNFYYLPSLISIRTDLDRDYMQTKVRNLDNPLLRIDSTVSKNFIWNRYYDLKFDLTRSLKMDFSATNISRIDEPAGAVDRNSKDTYDAWKDSVLTNLRNLGRTISYHHTFNFQYTVPLNKIPILSWISANAKYSTSYGWDAGPLLDTIKLGNQINNSRHIDLSGRLNLLMLYNKIKFLKQINEKFTKQKGPVKEKPKEKQTVTFENTYVLIKAGIARTIVHNLKTEDVKLTVKDEAGNEIKVKEEVVNENKVRFTAEKDYNKVQATVEGKVDKKPNIFLVILENATRILMGIRDIQIIYGQTDGTQLPGYLPKTKIMGLQSLHGMFAPGIPFILGNQDTTFGATAGRNGWLTTDSRLSTPFSMATNSNLSVTVNLEPIDGFKIVLNAMRGYTESSSLYYQYDAQTGKFNFSSGKVMTGNFSISVISWKTAFQTIDPKKQYKSQAFTDFRNYSIQIAERLAKIRHDIAPNNYDNTQVDPATNFPYGYGPTSPEVLVPAFFAAYMGESPNNAPLEDFPSWKYMRPNWKVTYEGLSNLDFLKKYIRSISLSHSYRSTYSVASFANNLDYNPDQDGLSWVQDQQQNFLPQFKLNAVSLNEQFAPLIGVDMNWENSLTTRFTINKQRTVSLSLADNEVIEMQNNEVVVGGGYRFNQVQIIINAGNGPKQFKSDLNLRADLSIRDSRTALHKLVEQDDSPSAGQQNVSIKLSADYKLGPSFNLRVFFDRLVNKPFVSTTYPTANTNIGFSVTFQLVQ